MLDKFIKRIKKNMKELKSIGVGSAAKIYGLSLALMGFVIGLLFALFGVVGGESIGRLGSFGLASIILFPLLYGVTGLVAGALFAFFYNIIAGWVGGLEIEVVTKHKV